MEKFDAIIIGTGQAGPSLAEQFVKNGQKVAIVERGRFGGSCVNYGCTPTKTLVANARAVHIVKQSGKYGIEIPSFKLDMKKVKARKDSIVNDSSVGLEKWLKNLKGCTVYEGHAHFEDGHTIQVNHELIQGNQIFINVGARPYIPKIPGLDQIPFFTNMSIIDIDFVPEHLVILGGGYIALEFAQIFSRFGSRVTIIQKHSRVMPKEDEDVSQAIEKILIKEGIEILTNAENFQILSNSSEGNITAKCSLNGISKEIHGSHLLIATGRVPNTDELQIEKANVAIDKKGFILVNDELRTSQSHIWALGDCNGRGAFTHTSYNDFEIVSENLFNHGKRKVSDRIPIYALFIDPPLGRVGMTEREVRESNYDALMATMPMSRVARAREKGETEGFLKILIEKGTKRILGASFLGIECDEVIQLIANVIYAKSPYTSITNGVHIHPTVSELIPTLLSQLQPLKTPALAK